MFHISYMQEERAAHTAVVIPDDQILIMGGGKGFNHRKSNKIININNNNNNNNDIPELPTGRRYHASVGIDNYVFVIGGRDGPNANTTNTVLKVNINNIHNPATKWEFVPPMQQKRCDFAAVAIKDIIYAVGGENGYKLSTIEMFDVTKRRSKWVILTARMATPRYAHCAVTVANDIYIIGGWDDNGNRLTSVEIFDTESQRLTKGPALPIPICGMSAVAVKSLVIVVGGQTTGRQAIKHVYVLDTLVSKPEWQRIGVVLQKARYYHTAVVVGDEVCICGGWDAGDNTLISVETISIVDLLPRDLHEQAGLLPVTEPPAAEGKTYLFDAFLTHNWGSDTKGRDNHQRVIRFKNELQKQPGIGNLWLDEERMTGNIMEQMSNGIDQSKLVIVFITQSYINKVAGRGPKGKKDNCYLEFTYAAMKKDLIAVVMEESCSDPSKWDGPVGFYLGEHLYYSFKNNSDLNQCVQEVAHVMREKMKQMGK